MRVALYVLFGFRSISKAYVLDLSTTSFPRYILNLLTFPNFLPSLNYFQRFSKAFKEKWDNWLISEKMCEK